MKKVIYILLISLLILLTGCNNSTGDNIGNNSLPGVNTASTTAEAGGIEVDKNLLDVEVTLPASFFEGKTLDEIKASAAEDGIKDVKQNEDGTIIYKMSKAKHSEMMEQYKQALEKAANDLVTGDATKDIFTEVTFNDKYNAYTVKVNKDKYGALTNMYLLGINISSLFYQMFDGVSKDDMSVAYDIIDAATGEKINSGVYPPAK